VRIAEEAEGDRKFVCWDDGSSLDFAKAHHAIDHAIERSEVGIFATQFLDRPKWSSVASGTPNAGTQGNPVTVTWSIVPDGTNTPSGSGSSDLRRWLGEIYGGSATGTASEQPWFPLLKSCFDTMAERSGLTLVYEPQDDGASVASFNTGSTGVRGDIRVSAATIDGEGDPITGSNTLGFAYAPNYGDIVLDSGDSFFENTSSDSLGLFNTLAHEIGHGIGLAHVCPLNRTKLMEPSITRSFRGPQFDARYSLQRQYGDEAELASGGRDNDSTASATALTPDENGLANLKWLGIDDNSDLDYFSFPAKRRDKLRVAVNPGNESYLEGEQDESCSTGENFDASAQQNLTLTLLDRDGFTTLSFSNLAPAGAVELLEGYEFEEAGTYYVQVRGSNLNAAQLYTLSLEVTGAPLTPLMSLTSSEITAESGFVKNSRLDDRETVKVTLDFLNSGFASTDDLTATFFETPGVTFFTPEVTFSDIAVGESGQAELVFAASGTCGSEISFTMQLDDESGYRENFTLTFAIGQQLESTLISESFEGSGLPVGWSSETTGAGINWLPDARGSSEGAQSAFGENVPDQSSAALISPAVTLGSLGGTLSFSHDYDHEDRWDGSVLEASLDGGAWFDLPEHASVGTISGGYSARIRSSAKNILAGRTAWTADSRGFVKSEFTLPAFWSGQEIRFRWVIAHDLSASDSGWLVDDILLISTTGVCENHRPELALTGSAAALDEGGDALTLELASELPLLDPITLSLIISGNGEASDLSGLTEVTLPTGQTEAQLSLSAISDSATEGSETITLTIPDDAENYAASESSSVTLTIGDPSGFSAWSSTFFSNPPPPNADADGDGWSNLAEYLLGLDPTDVAERPDFRLLVSDDTLTIPLAPLPSRSDATLGVEVSDDLRAWSATEFSETTSGLELPKGGAARFFRLTFTLEP